MNKSLLLLIMICFCGCSIGWRISHVHGTISGTNINTGYGPANGNLVYDATTCLGNCPKSFINHEVFKNAN